MSRNGSLVASFPGSSPRVLQAMESWAGPGNEARNLVYHVKLNVLYMWQSQVEIEHYSVAYFARIAAFEAL